MSKTVKRKVSNLKAGSKIKIPAQTLTVRMKSLIEAPTVKGEIYALKVSGDSGPYKGQVIDMICHSNEELDFMPWAPWPQRLVMWCKRFLWDTTFKGHIPVGH